MTILDLTRSRVDLFTDIHKAVRKALFDLSLQAGATDWDDPAAVTALTAAWRPVADLLRCHTEHENNYIFRLLDGTSSAAAVPEDDHRDLEDLLDDLDERLVSLAAPADPSGAMAWYRDLNRYLAATLEHLHLEETVLLPGLWAARTDDELTACRAAFLAATPPGVIETTMRLFRAALPPAKLHAMGLPTGPRNADPV